MKSHNETHIESRVFDYANDAPGYYDKLAFSLIIQKITHGSVLDIGCGPIPLFWAMGYIGNVDTITFADLSEDYLDILENEIADLSPLVVDQKYSQVISYLQEKGMLELNSSELAENIISAFSGTHQINFITESTDECYDFILSCEALNVIHTPEDFESAIKNAANMLHQKGKLLGFFTRRKEFDENSKKLAELNLTGKCNPDVEMVQSALRHAGLEIELLHREENPELEKYPEAIFFIGVKP